MLDAAESSFPGFEAANSSRSAVTHPEAFRLPPGIKPRAAHTSRGPTLIGFQARVIGSSDWHISRNRACDRFQFDPLPSLLFTSNALCRLLHAALVIVRLSSQKPVTDDFTRHNRLLHRRNKCSILELVDVLSTTNFKLHFPSPSPHVKSSGVFRYPIGMLPT